MMLFIARIAALEVVVLSVQKLCRVYCIFTGQVVQTCPTLQHHIEEDCTLSS